jgi:hypothetical protein
MIFCGNLPGCRIRGARLDETAWKDASTGGNRIFDGVLFLPESRPAGTDEPIRKFNGFFETENRGSAHEAPTLVLRSNWRGTLFGSFC